MLEVTKAVGSLCDPPLEISKKMAKLREQLIKTEYKIIEITGKKEGDFRWTHKHSNLVRVAVLIDKRKELLNKMFAGTPAEVERMRVVNDRLFDLTNKMYARTAALYRAVLALPRDENFDDDIMVRGTLVYSYNGPGSVLQLENDDYYGSAFARMLDIIDTLYAERIDGYFLREIEETTEKSIEPTDRPDMSDAELGFANPLDDGDSWAEGWLWHDSLKDICICHAVHAVCTHLSGYSIPDLLRMNDFWCEVKTTHQHIVEQDGSRWQWWERCSLAEFQHKFHAEAKHRPRLWRKGQYVVNRTAQLFPEATKKPVWAGPNDCFNNDTKIDAYLEDVFNALKKEL